MSAPKGMTAIDSGIEDGIEWATVNAPMYGAVNGYARVPDGHPWLGLDYDAIDVEINGGLTFADGDWIGFDTLHSGDYWPGAPNYWDRPDVIHWTPAMVADEARSLARQVAQSSVSRVDG